MNHGHRPLALTGATLATTALVTGGSLAIAGPSDAAGHAPSCIGSQLAVTHTRAEGATEHGSMLLEFRNRSSRKCTMRGYPGFDAIGRHGTVKAHAKRTREGFVGGSHRVRTVTVHPGQYASAVVEWVDIKGGGACSTASHYAFTPPNTRETVRRRGPIPVCGLQVHPTEHGRLG